MPQGSKYIHLYCPCWGLEYVGLFGIPNVDKNFGAPGLVRTSTTCLGPKVTCKARVVDRCVILLRVEQQP